MLLQRHFLGSALLEFRLAAAGIDDLAPHVVIMMRDPRAALQIFRRVGKGATHWRFPGHN